MNAGDDPEKTVLLILREYKVHNANVLFREDASTDEFIDIIMGANRFAGVSLSPTLSLSRYLS